MDNNKIAAAVMTLGAAAGVGASPITVSQTINLGLLLNGGSTSIQFDLNAALAGQGLTAANVMSGQLVVYGVSDASYGWWASQSHSQYVEVGSNTYYYYSYQSGGGYYVCTGYSWGNCISGYYVQPTYMSVYSTYRELLRSVDLTYSDSVMDQMVVSAGASSAVDLADQASNSIGAYGGWIYEYYDYNGIGGGNGYDSYYRQERNIYEAMSGALEVNLGLDAAALIDFGMDGILSAGVAASVGQFRVNQAILTLQVDDFVAAPASVPEPGSLVLTGSAAALAAAAMRRRRRNPQ